MSKVEDAIQKLRRSRSSTPGLLPSREQATPARPPAPPSTRQKAAVDGSRHHVSEESLIRGGLLAPLEHAAPVADEFRKIKRPLLANAADTEAGADGFMNVIMIASALPGAGKTFCAVNLAVSISLERELNVLLVDADVAKPHISREFGLGDAPGLIDLLLDETQDISDVLVRTDLNDIQVLPAGRKHPQATELLASERMSRLVTDLARRYPDRIIILDSPPLLITSEAQALADQVGQIALVVEAAQTSQQVLTQTIEVLDPTKAVNMILNKARHRGAGYHRAGYGYYGYEHG